MERIDHSYATSELLAQSRDILQKGLEQAATKIRAHSRKYGLANGLATLSYTCTWTCLCIAVAALLMRLFSLPMGTVWIVAVVGMSFSASLFFWQILLTLNSRPNDDEVAERLDVACGNQNAIATAFDLIHAKDSGPMALTAIAHGITSVKTFGRSELSLNPVTLPWRRLGYRAAIGAAAITAAILLPIHPLGRASQYQLGGQPVGRMATLLTLADSRPGAEAEANEPPGLTTRSQRSAGHSGVSPNVAKQNPPAGSEPSPSSNGSENASAESQNLVANQSVSGRREGERKQSTVKDPSADSVSNSRKSVGHVIHNTSAGDLSNDAAHAAGSAEGGSTNDTPSKDSAEHNNESGMKEGGSGGSDGRADVQKSKDTSGDGGGGQGGKASRGHGHSEQSGDSVGGNGQGGGQNPPKKSRGVALLMLGMRQPDVLRGPTLPGPDERVKLQVPPVPNPGAPADAASANPRTSDEPVVPDYRVPADMTGIVGNYFEQFHNDQDVSKTAP